MDKPIYEIPMTPDDGSDDAARDALNSWEPTRVAPAADERPSFESLLADLAAQSAAPLPPVDGDVARFAPVESAVDSAPPTAQTPVFNFAAPIDQAPVFDLAAPTDQAPVFGLAAPVDTAPAFDFAPPVDPAPAFDFAPTKTAAIPVYVPDAEPYLIPIPQAALVEPVPTVDPFAALGLLGDETVDNAGIPTADAAESDWTEPPVETVVYTIPDLATAANEAPVFGSPAGFTDAAETTVLPVQQDAAADFLPHATVDSGPRLVPTGRRAADPVEAEVEAPRVFVPVETDSLNEEEVAALGSADPELLFALEEVVLQNASDLHITSGAPPSIRIDGGLQALAGAQKWMPERVASALYSLLSEEQKEQFEREHELDFAYATSGARFRVNYYLQRGSIGGAFRLIPREIRPLSELGVPESVSRFAKLPRGLVLVTGPTGSGKSTTLAALIDLVNRTRADHIVTVEDPIEFLHKHQMSLVNQREVGHDTHSFAAALKHVLRQDPDVILIGELRDLETISVALTAAETGHLVFATLHTQDAAQTIDRVIDVFPPHQQGQVRAQLAATLRGVVCQTLVKKAHGRGRVVATEVLVTTPAIGNLIREGKTYQITSMMQAGGDLGMHTMDQHLADLVNSGQITRRAAQEKAHDAEGIGRLINRIESTTEASAQAFAASDIDFGDSYSGTVR